MVKRRKLSDLYVTGKTVTFDDGQGPVTVWLQKLSPIDHDTALRKANAARARVLMARNLLDGDEYLDAYAQIDDIGDRDILVRYLIGSDLARHEVYSEAELAGAEEWSEDNYLQGLRDAWDSELARRHAEDPEDPEANRVFGELQRFVAQINERQATVEADLLRDWSDTAPDELVRAAVLEFLTRRGDRVFMEEFQKCCVWLATRNPCRVCLVPEDERSNRQHEAHEEHHFANRDEVDVLHPTIFGQLTGFYDSMSVDVVEGKGLAAPPDSSSSSGPSAEAETVPSSGPPTVAP